jgi:hypothetical protein
MLNFACFLIFSFFAHFFSLVLPFQEGLKELRSAALAHQSKRTQKKEFAPIIYVSRLVCLSTIHFSFYCSYPFLPPFAGLANLCSHHSKGVREVTNEQILIDALRALVGSNNVYV